MFIRRAILTKEQKQQVSEMTGKIMLWILEGRSRIYMANQLNLDLWELEQNIDETLYAFKKEIGWKRYLKILFRK